MIPLTDLPTRPLNIICRPLLIPPPDGDGSARLMWRELLELANLAHQAAEYDQSDRAREEIAKAVHSIRESLGERKPSSPYLDLKQGADYCHLAPGTLSNHIDEIRRVKGAGRKVLFTREALDEWMAKRRRK